VSWHTETASTANLGKKGDIFVVRFRFSGKELKKSLKIRERDEADAARSLVELTIHRLRTGFASNSSGRRARPPSWRSNWGN
jgi:hypothetical protein